MLMKRVAVLGMLLLLLTACSATTPGLLSNPTARPSVDGSAPPSVAATVVAPISTAAGPQTAGDLVTRCDSLRPVIPVPGANTATVIGAFETNEAGFVQFQAALTQDSGVTTRDPQATPLSPAFAAQPVLICYLEGQFGQFPISASPGGDSGLSGPSRLVVRIGQDAVVDPIVTGPAENIPVVDPNQLESTAAPQ
jgi:hypothetical protein